MAIEELARKAQRAHRIIGVVASGCVREDSKAARRECVQQAGLACVLANVGTADGDRNNLRSAGVHSSASLREVLVLAGPD